MVVEPAVAGRGRSREKGRPSMRWSTTPGLPTQMAERDDELVPVGLEDEAGEP